MSLRLEMLQVARLAPNLLGPEASDLVEHYTRSQQNADGGFKNRDGISDLYYTSFAVDILTALQRFDDPTAEKVGNYLSQQEAADLDFVHVACLARLFSVVPTKPESVEEALSRLEDYRSGEGGYSQSVGAESGSCYACFLAYGAYADHQRMPARPEGIPACLNQLAQPNGGWANATTFPIPNLPATAAAVALSRNLRLPVPAATSTFLLESFHVKSGGFVPFPGAPLPDLLSTAVGLHALDGLQTGLSQVREPCLDFVDTLWTAEGGFYGQWDDDTLDLEYTYYGLLALGHLALA